MTTSATVVRPRRLVNSPTVERLMPAPPAATPWPLRFPLIVGRFVLALIWCGLTRPILRACARRPSLVSGVMALSAGIAYWFWVTVIGLIMAPFALAAVLVGLYLIQLHAVERRVQKRFIAAGWMPKTNTPRPAAPVPTGSDKTDTAALRAHLATYWGTKPNPPSRFRRLRRSCHGNRLGLAIGAVVVALGLAAVAFQPAPEVPQPPERDGINDQANN